MIIYLTFNATQLKKKKKLKKKDNIDTKIMESLGGKLESLLIH